MKNWFPILALLCFAFPLAAQNSPDPAQPTQTGRWTSRWQNGGLFLDYDGIPVIQGGIVQVFSADYGRGYYGSGSKPPAAEREALANGGVAYTAKYTFEREGQTFAATQRVEVLPDNRVILSLRAKWDGKESALLEWNAARLWAYPFVGAWYEATPVQADSSHHGRIGIKLGKFAPKFDTLTVSDTTFGTLTLAAQNANLAATMFDSRQNSQSDRKTLWIGYSGSTLEPGKETINTLTLTIMPVNPTSAPKAKTPALNIAAKFLPKQQIPVGTETTHPLIIPRPKNVAWTYEMCPLPDRLTYRFETPKSEAGKNLRLACQELLREIKRKYKVTPKPASEAFFTVKIGTVPNVTQSEGYALTIAKDKIEIVGVDAQGAFYGLQTLRQIVEQSNGKSLPCVRIVDYPSLKFRAAHIFVGRNALPFHKKLIERIFSRYKMNVLVLECEYSQWKTHPEIHVPNSMPLADLKAEVVFARQHFIEPIPLVNTLGHSEWMFKNKSNLELAEDRNYPYAYNASDPKVYDFVFDVYSEAVEIFKPKYFHIGHDEVKIVVGNQPDKYPARLENIAKGITKLFLDDTLKIAEWLRARKVRPMLWGDMLLHESEGATVEGVPKLTAANAESVEDARMRRAALPKDAIIADWRYEPGSEQRNGLSILQDAGFETLGSAWFQGENIIGWAQQTIANKALGTIQTTWAGYDSSESLLYSDFKQFAAYIWAAEYAWSGGNSSPRPLGTDEGFGRGSLPYDAGTVFARSYRGTVPALSWSMDFGESANVSLITNPYHLPFFPLGKNEPPPKRTTSLEPLSQSSVEWGNRAVGLRGTGTPQNFPDTIKMAVNRKAQTLIFTHAAGVALEPNTLIAAYEVEYADGRKVEIPLRYGREIRALDDVAPSASMSVSATTVPYLEEFSLKVRHLLWTNPHPKTSIVSITLRSQSPLAGTLLFGISGYGK